MISRRFATWNLVGVLAILLILFFWIDPTGRASEWQRFFGRFHPAVVHIPIGILMFGFALAILKSFGWLKDGDSVLDVALVLGSWAGIEAIAAGSWLAQMGAYPEDLLFRHKLTGYIATAVPALILFIRATSPQDQPRTGFQYGLWVVVLAALFVGGDLGGRMTHGAGFASEYAPGFVKPILGQPTSLESRFDLANPGATTIFDGIVVPIFREKCTSCHGANRGKGRLRLHTREAIEGHKGDDPLLVADRPEESLLIQRVVLPDGHEDQMPPAFDAKPISHSDVEILKWWIAEGASFDMLVSDATIPGDIRTILEAYGLGEIRTGIFALDVSVPDTNLVNDLRSQGASVRELADDSPFLSVRCRSADQCFGTNVLGALGPNIAWLDASESDVADQQLAALSGLPNLVRLDLSETTIDGSGLGALSELDYLEYLNLFGSRVDNKTLALIQEIEPLRALYLWQTNVTEDAADELSRMRPELDVNIGTKNESESK